MVMENSCGGNVVYLIFSFTGTGLLSDWVTESFRLNSLCLLQLLYLCTNQVRGDVGETVQLLFPVFTVRCFYSDFVHAFVRISTKSNFILLRLYGEMFYIN